MKLLFVVHQFFPRFFTGTEQYCLALAQAGRAAGHDIEIFCLEPDFGIPDPGFLAFREDFDGLPVHRVTVGPGSMPNPELAEYDNPAVGQEFARRVEQLQPELVHFFHVRYLGANLLQIARDLGAAVAVHLMDFWYMCPRITLLKDDGSLCDGPESATADCLRCAHSSLSGEVSAAALPTELPAYQPGLLRHTRRLPDRLLAATHRNAQLRACWEMADRIFAPSRFLAEQFRSNGYPDSQLRILSYGIDTSRLEGLQRQPSPQLRVGFMGTIAVHKGVHVLVDAFMQVADPRLSLTVHGRLTDFPEYVTELQQTTAADSRIHFAGPFEKPELGRILSEIDLLVVPSLWFENTPFVVLEALAAGVPVLTSALGGMTEAIEEGVTGRSFPAGDAGALATILAQLAADPARVAEMAERTGAAKSLSDNWAELEVEYAQVLRASSGRERDHQAFRPGLERDLYDLESSRSQPADPR